MCRRAGDISLIRPQTITAELKVANQPERHVALPRRGLRDCLSEELRRLDADDVYFEVLSKGMALVAKQAAAADAKEPAKAPSAKAPSAKAPAADAPAVKAPVRRTAAAKASVTATAKAPAPAAKPRSTAARRAAATGVDDPPAITDDESPIGIPPETDPAAGNGEAPAGVPDAPSPPRTRRRATASKPAESS